MTLRHAPSPFSTTLASVAAIACASLAFAHEGHAPLPTKGVLVDQEKGTIVLSGEARDALAVETVEAVMRPSEESVLAYAALQTPWTSHALASSRVAGRVSALHVQPGERVQAGQLLATIESLDLKTLELDLVNARAQADLSERSLAQVQPLAEKLIVPGKQLREARATHRQNRNGLQMAEAKLASLGLSTAEIAVIGEGRTAGVGEIGIYSPISGTVTHVDVPVGRVIEPTEHVLEILDLATVWVRMGVLEKDLHRAEMGQSVALELIAFPGETFEAVVTAIDRTVDPATGLATVWAELQNDSADAPRFLPGMEGHVRIEVSDGSQRLAIPAQALISDGAERYVLVEWAATERATELQRQNVVVERQTSLTVYLRSGDVFPGDRVVTTGSRELGASFVQGVLRLSPEAKKGIGLQLTTVGPMSVPETIFLDGRVELPPEGRAVASSRVAGTLLKIAVDRGQTVKAGDVLAEVTSLELQDLQLEMIAAQLEVETLDETLESYRSLSQEQLLSNRQLWEAETQKAVAANRRDTARAKLQAIGVASADLDQALSARRPVATLTVRAPIDGTIVRFERTLGQAVRVDEPIFEIHDPSRALVQAFLAERDLSRAALGQSVRVRVTADPTYLGTGTVVRSGRAFDADDRALSLWVELEDQPEVGLQQGMLARVTLVLDQPQPTLAVPKEALLREGAHSFVFVAKRDGTFERRRVEIGRRSDLNVEIVSGLAAGESVAASGVESLRTAYAAVR
ncbi:MAG TPA: efflux RND transporter periplasmic adaptor subunit [Pirellulaceae bacterium]|nr:efflux RND transporter periplasmic adaptor subunit [Pirellulaceae bacterium]